ncbi:hypothetical protein [Christensenella tenuis]|uniref:Uncharacterized protein n=1 Tax=Christensenella tenuis TaxID=2763033 RepID=A0ABR7EB14_9FIRM|nr:hypothetical protein [Christensenella tenuis]MBC5646964.1 hypothetical protein [Christensenella tenuis]
MRNRALAILVILLGAFSFLMFVPGFFLIGLILAIAGVIAGSATLKILHFYSIAGMLLSIIACIIYMFAMGAVGVSIFN